MHRLPPLQTKRTETALLVSGLVVTISQALAYRVRFTSKLERNLQWRNFLGKYTLTADPHNKQLEFELDLTPNYYCDKITWMITSRGGEGSVRFVYTSPCLSDKSFDTYERRADLLIDVGVLMLQFWPLEQCLVSQYGETSWNTFSVTYGTSEC